MARELLGILGTATVASSCVVFVVLPLRKPLRTFFGPSLAYFFWSLVPTSMLCPVAAVTQHGLKNGPSRSTVDAFIHGPRCGGIVVLRLGLAWVRLLSFAWASGALLFGLELARRQRRFIASLGLPLKDDAGVFHATFPTGSPVVVGFVRPKIVIPSDFATRYAAEEQALILAHEQMHVRRGDLITNGMWALPRCIFLVQSTGSHCRPAKSLRPGARLRCGRHAKLPQLAQTVCPSDVEAQIAHDALPLSCYWPSVHPLKERIMFLRQSPAQGVRRAIGRILIGTCVCLVGYATSAVRPDVAAVDFIHD